MATVQLRDKEYYLDFIGIAELDMRRLARELAIGLVPHNIIFDAYGIGEREWAELSHNKQFLALLQEEGQTWMAAKNARERIELKTWAMIEEALPQLFAYLHDPDFADAAKVSLFSAMQKQVGIGQKDGIGASDPGQKVSITINTGSNQVKLEHQVPTIDVTPEVIEPTPEPTSPTPSDKPRNPWRM